MCAAGAISLYENEHFSQIKLTKAIDMKTVEEFPNSKEWPNENEELNHLRQRRTLVFRPLFAYRQEQIEKHRLHSDAQRRKDQHVNRHIDPNCANNNYQSKQQSTQGNTLNCHCHCN